MANRREYDFLFLVLKSHIVEIKIFCNIDISYTLKCKGWISPLPVHTYKVQLEMFLYKSEIGKDCKDEYEEE
jgi:hypothetical protein